jgi:transcription elongation factor SPT6
MRVVFVNDEIPQVFGASQRSIGEYGTQDQLIRQAVGLARYLSDPLQEIASIASVLDELLCLKMHPQQTSVDTFDLVKYLHREIIDTVNANGVDVNSVVNKRFRSSQLQFVSGLGPRKGEHLRQQIMKKARGLLKNREQLIVDNLLGPTVFQNCAGFMMIYRDYGDQQEHTLAETRVHPENYSLAVKMAKSALDDEDDDDEDLCIEEIMKDEHKRELDSLDLEAYAESLRNQAEASGGSTETPVTTMKLYDIKQELQDPRKPPAWFMYRELQKNQIFEAITGETDSSLRPGSLMTVTVQKVLPRGVIVQHDSGLRGYITIERFSDSYEQGMRPEDFPLTEKVGQFQAIPTRVVELTPDNLFPAKPDQDGQIPRKGPILTPS